MEEKKNQTPEEIQEEKLYELAESAFTEVYEYILGELSDTLTAKKVPAGVSYTTDYLYYLAKELDAFQGEKSGCPLLAESRELIVKHVDELLDTERLAIQMYHFHLDYDWLEDEAIVNEILDNWVSILLDFKRDYEADPKNA